MSDRVIRVLVADDHAVVREGIRHVLGRDHGFEVVGESANGTDVVSLAETLRPDVIVVDISMPGQSGITATEAITARRPDARVLVLSIHEDEEYVTRSLRAGALGYLRKDSSPAELRQAVRSVSDGERYLSPALARRGASSVSEEAGGRIASLTVREREVLVEIARGASNKEIAALFSISVRTVESHRDAVMRKLDLRGAAALTKFAIQHGLIDAG